MTPIELGDFAAMEPESPFPGVERRFFHAERSTVSRYTFAGGASFPLHHHPEEQVTLIESGSVTFTIDEQVHELTAGAWSVVGPDVPHGLTAGPDGATIIGIVTPRRTSSSDYTVVAQ
ncbi:MAG: cupin domain-containing protein [Actinomycetia bacterium]|nr:cupin domain-containing protein [Actinomycetes bacterium]